MKLNILHHADNGLASPEEPNYAEIYAELQNLDEVRRLMLSAVESGDIGALMRMTQKDDFLTAMNRVFIGSDEEFAWRKENALRFFFELAAAAIHGGFDPEEAEALFYELGGRLSQIADLDDLVKLEKLVITTYGDPLFRKSQLQQVSLTDRVNRFIQDNYMNKMTIAQISNALYLHPNYLMKKYKTESGKSIMQAVNDKRIFEAVNLLRTTKIPIEKISKMTGFETPQYFNTVFKKRMGKSPNQIRREARNRIKEKESSSKRGAKKSETSGAAAETSSPSAES